jgi:hypothetical protein
MVGSLIADKAWKLIKMICLLKNEPISEDFTCKSVFSASLGKLEIYQHISSEQKLKSRFPLRWSTCPY